MSNILEFIGDLFGNIFGNSPEAQKRREIRKLEEFLALQHPPIYQRQGRKVLPPLALSLVQLRRILGPLEELFKRTVSHPDPKLAEFHTQYLLENLLEGDISRRRAELSFEALKARFLAAPSVPDAITAANRDFTNLVTAVKKAASPALLVPLERVHVLAEFFKHPLDDFLGTFGLQPDGSGAPHPADGERVLMSLLDLYFVYRPLVFDEALETALAVLFEKVSPQKATENLSASRKVLNKARILVSGVLSPNVLEPLIRVLQDDPVFDPPRYRIEHDFLEKYLLDIKEKFDRDRDRAAGEITVSGLEEELRKLFLDRPLLELTNYNSLKNQVLTERGLAPLSLVKPAAIFKSFVSYHLESYLLSALERLIIDGIFLDKGWGTQLGNSHSICKAFGQDLLDLDESLTLEGRASVAQLEKLLQRQGAPGWQATANRLIDQINKRIEAFLVERCQHLHQLAHLSRLVLEDFKRPTPEYISNIRSFGDKRNRAVLQDLLNGFKATVSLLNILKNFLVMPFLKVREEKELA